MKKPANSILIPKDQLEAFQANSQHPMSYFRTRNHFLENVMEQINLKSNLNAPDLQRNVHVQYLTRAYDKMKKKVVTAQKERQRYIDPNTYSTILDTQPALQKEKMQREQRMLQIQRNQLYDNFIQNYVEQVQPQAKPQVQILPTKVSRNLSEADQRRIMHRQREMDLLDEEINQIKFELEVEANKGKDYNPRHTCTNMSLIQKMSGSILSSYMVHFDQVFNLLIDQVLVEEVKHLNSIQQDWKQQRQAQKPRTQFPPEHHRLIELVKTLDDLCDV